MLRRLLLLFLFLAGCSKGPQADLPSIAEARSLAAEWALVNEQAAKGQLTQKYIQSMHQSIREQLQTTQKSLTQPQADYAAEIAAVARARDDAPPSQLRAHADKLKQIENALESA
jgi:hypothetical protein